MNWNESVKRIIDFIPIFERVASGVADSESKLNQAISDIENKINEQRYNSESNDSSELIDKIDSLGRKFESFRKSETDQINKAISEINSELKLVRQELNSLLKIK